ncbi:hypothetical protein NE865_14932 [Phthorimaea operculella]|nr:hypothetical protein NE865_14932 [Phthorimaea operculella]
MDKYLGKKYVMVKQENFEDYLLFLGKGLFARKAALSLQPEVCLTKTLNRDNDNEDKDNDTQTEGVKDRDKYTFRFSSLLANFDMDFVPGEEFDEIRPDGKMKSVITFEDNKMIHIQKDEKGRVTKHVREYFQDKMVTITTAEGLDKTVIRYHELVQ